MSSDDDFRRFYRTVVPGTDPQVPLTVAEYLDCLTVSIWHGIGSEKHGSTGNSDWREDLINALRAAEILTWENPDDFTDDDNRRANHFIGCAISGRSEVEQL